MTQSIDGREDDAVDRAKRAVSRRSVLAGAGTAVVATTAGCSFLADQFAGMVLEDVNVFNGTGERTSGTIEVVGPDDETVLSESFDIKSSENENGGNESETADSEQSTEGAETYSDVWQGAGEYEVTVQLDDGYEIDGETDATETVTIENPDEEMLAAFLGAEESAGIHFAVGESLSDFEETSAAENAS